MTTLTSATPTPVSTSTPAPTSRQKVRRKQPTLTAEKLSSRQNVFLPGNQLAIGLPGDFLISDEHGPVDLQKDLKLYDFIEAGMRVPEAHRQRLESILGLGSTQSAENLVAAADRLAKLEIGGLKVDFTPGQWEELRRKAAAQGQSLEVYLARLVQKFGQDFWGL